MKKANRKSVLIVDDDTASINVLTDILEKEYNIYGTKSGSAAVNIAKSKMPDVILLDIVMPEMDGYGVITELKKHEETCDIPVIFVTKLDDEKSIEKGLEYGASDYITKPFHPARIEYRVENQIKLVEQLRKQKILTQIQKRALVGEYTDSNSKNLMAMPSEFMDVTQVLLYLVEEHSGDLICRREWIRSGYNKKTCIGEKFSLNNLAATAIQSLLTGDSIELCISSNNQSFRESMKPVRGDLQEFITIPFMDKGRLCGVLDFSREDEEREWSSTEIDFAILFSSIFADVFMRDIIKR